MMDEIIAAIREGRPKRISIVGVGNPARGDDGAGIAVVRALRRAQSDGQARFGVQLILGFETPESATGDLRAFRPDLVVLVDAAAGKHPPGAPFLVPPGDIAEEDVSTHRVPLSLLVRYLEEDVGVRTIVLGIQPKLIRDSPRLSAPVKRAVGLVVAHLSEYLF